MKKTGILRKMMIPLLAAAIVAVPVGLTACGNAGDGGLTTGGKFDGLTTAESVYGFSAASAGMLISAMNGGEAAALASGYVTASAATDSSGDATGGSGETEVTPSEDPVLSEIDGYMALVDSLLSDGGFTTVVESSDREGYTEKTTVTYRNMGGDSLSYVMYYNEILIPDYDDDDDWDETEEEYAIEGVMVIDGADYTIRGERSYEEEEGEVESETEFRVTLGENEYMLVEQGYESEGSEREQEYEYSVVRGGRTVERASFSYEEEHDETELKMTSYDGTTTTVFYFDRETERGGEVIRIRVGERGSARTYIVRPVTAPDGTVTYEYTVRGTR